MNEIKELLTLIENETSQTTSEKCSVPDALFEYRSDSVLKNMAKKDKEYQKSLEEINGIELELKNSNLSQEQWNVIDKALSAYNDNSVKYARIAYCLGLQDGIDFFREMLKAECQ